MFQNELKLWTILKVQNSILCVQMIIPKYVIVDRMIWLLVWWGEQEAWSVYWALIVVWFPTQKKAEDEDVEPLDLGEGPPGDKESWEMWRWSRSQGQSCWTLLSLSLSLPLSRTLRYTLPSIIAGRDVLSKSRVICLVNRTQLTNKTGHPSFIQTWGFYVRKK